MTLRTACAWALAAWLGASNAGAQPPLFEPSRGKSAARATVAVTSEPAAVHAGERVTIRVDVVPARGIHVYAPGNKGYIPVALDLQLPPGVSADPPVYPAGQDYVFGALKEVVKVFKGPFQVRQSVRVPPSAGPLEITGTFRYQACDDRVCFPVATVPVRTVVDVKPRSERSVPLTGP